MNKSNIVIGQLNYSEMDRLYTANIRQFPSKDILCIVGEKGYLGKGNYGRVQLGKQKIHGWIAIKCMSMDGDYRQRERTKRKIFDEIHILQQCTHENVVRIYGYTEWSPGNIGIVMEYLPNGNLWHLLSEKDIKIGIILRLRICSEVASALTFIHNLFSGTRLTHGDLKTENILLTIDLHAKIADFGSSRWSEYTGHSTVVPFPQGKNQFTEIYAPPELLNNPSLKLRPSCDVYSFGMIVYIVLSRKLPLSNQNRTVVDIYLHDIRNGKFPNLEFIKDIKLGLGRVDEIAAVELLETEIKNCWKLNPDDRTQMVNIKERLEEQVNEFPPEDIQHQVVNVTRKYKNSFPSSTEHEFVAIDRLRLENEGLHHGSPSASSTVVDATLFSPGGTLINRTLPAQNIASEVSKKVLHQPQVTRWRDSSNLHLESQVDTSTEHARKHDKSTVSAKLTRETPKPLPRRRKPTSQKSSVTPPAYTPPMLQSPDSLNFQPVTSKNLLQKNDTFAEESSGRQTEAAKGVFTRKPSESPHPRPRSASASSGLRPLNSFPSRSKKDFRNLPHKTE